jgi:hypothetical protein
MISIKEVEQLHRILIFKFGGSHGIRNNASYEELIKQSGFAKNRHGFNLKQGWWKS